MPAAAAAQYDERRGALDMSDLHNPHHTKSYDASLIASNLNSQSLDPMHMTPDEFAKLLKSEYDKYERVVKLTGVRID